MLRPVIIEDIDIWNHSQYKAQYFRKLLQNTDYVLCSVSAAEYLGLCNWTVSPEVYVQTKTECMAQQIEIASSQGLFYTTINQTINDILADADMDEQVIMEALADQYFKNQYADLHILPENQRAFEKFKSWAEEYYISY